MECKELLTPLRWYKLVSSLSVVLLPNPQVDTATIISSMTDKLALFTQLLYRPYSKYKQNQNEKKVSTYKNLIFWLSAFICLHPSLTML